MALFFAVSFTLFLLLRGSGRLETLPAAALARDEQESCTVLAMAEEGGTVGLVCREAEGCTLYCLKAATGEILVREHVSAPAVWAAFRGDTLFVRQDLAAGVRLAAYDRRTLQEKSCRELGWLPLETELFDCDESGCVYAVLQGENQIRILLSRGEARTAALPASAEFLEAADGALWIWAQNTFTVYRGKTVLEIPCQARPLALLGGGIVLSADGLVQTAEDGEMRTLFLCPQNLFPGNFYCLDGEKCLIVSDGDRNVMRYAMTGELRGRCVLEKSALGICAAGGVYRRDGWLYYAPFRFGEPAVPEPTASPGPSVSPEPVTPPVIAEGSFLVMSPGATVEELREYFKPEAVQFTDAAGHPVTGGRLATGMQAGDWAVVIRGDCNGTGTVTAGDLRAAISFCLEPEREGSPQYRAADLDGSGIVDTQDLLAFSAMLEKGSS